MKQKIKKILPVFLISGILILASCEEKDETPEPVTGSEAPEFVLTSLEGSQVSLSDYMNKVVVLFFFGYNCPSCKAVSPDIQSMLVTPFDSHSDYQFLGLDQWNGNAAAVEAFKTLTGVTFPLLLQASGVAADYKTTYDRLVVIDKSSNIVFSGTQVAASDLSTVKQKVEMLLAGS